MSVAATQLVFASDAGTGFSGLAGFKAYGIPYQLVLVPKEGITLPTLQSANNQTGNYGGITILGEVSYDYNGTWKSALTVDQFNALYAYQVQFGVRMVRLNTYPTPEYGVTTAVAGGGCCNAGVSSTCV